MLKEKRKKLNRQKRRYNKLNRKNKKTKNKKRNFNKWHKNNAKLLKKRKCNNNKSERKKWFNNIEIKNYKELIKARLVKIQHKIEVK